MEVSFNVLVQGQGDTCIHVLIMGTNWNRLLIRTVELDTRRFNWWFSCSAMTFAFEFKAVSRYTHAPRVPLSPRPAPLVKSKK